MLNASRYAGQRAAKGAVTVLTVVAMLSLTLATAVAMTSLLLTGRHTVSLRLEREVAFRHAEAALIDAEADLLASLAGTPSGRLSPLPAAGACGRAAQQGICTPAAQIEPPWVSWLAPTVPATAGPAVDFGAFTGSRAPAIPADMGGATQPPRYLIEPLPLPTGAPSRTFRITALGQGRDPAVRVVLQTHWVAPASATPVPLAGTAYEVTDDGSRRIGRVGWRELVPVP